MIFGRTSEENMRAIPEHLWFAWYFVRLEDGRHVWLDYVWRRREAEQYCYKYRTCADSSGFL